MLGHGVSVVSGVASGEVMFKLSFDVGKEGRCSNSEEVGGEPVVAEFVFHEHQVFGGLFSGADSSGGFESDFDTCSILVIADEAGHDEGEGESGVDWFFAG